MDISKKVNWVLSNKIIWSLLLIGNILGTLDGIYNYSLQLSQSPLHMWLFIPDCPIYSGLFCVFLVLYRYKRNYPAFNFFLFIGLIKYAFWTYSADLLYASQMRPDILTMNTILAVFHTGMILDAVLIIPFMKPVSITPIALNLAWLFSNDLIDYFLGTHPLVPSHDFLQILLIQNIAMNILLTLVFIWLVRKR